MAEESENQSEDVAFKLPRYFWIACICVVAALIGGYILPWALNFNMPDNAAAFGDMWGFANAIISGLALIGVVAAIAMQRHELHLQQIELKETRKVLISQSEHLEKQGDQFRMQNQILQEQQIEARFFRMLELHHEIASTVVSRGSMHKGKLVFIETVDSLREIARCDYQLAREKFRAKNLAESFHHFIRNATAILRLIDSSASERQKELFSQIWNSQLSQSEIDLLAVYACFGEVDSKLPNLLAMFHLLVGSSDWIRDFVVNHGLLDREAFEPHEDFE